MLLRKWLDLPVFLLANVAVDIEVLVINRMRMGWPHHRYCHTLLIGTAIGIACGLICYSKKPLLRWLMKTARIPYETSLLKMLISGILGVWFHVLIDGIYHYDVKMFWPITKNPLWNILSQPQIRLICLLSFIPLAITYIFAVRKFNKNKKQKLSR
ncbi:MAG: metal-dependent hydrolase [Anaerohalosphaeraceae bacterium]|nr:metal-dependent hydrolase [Anaerohalosphaeraceae bacterium]